MTQTRYRVFLSRQAERFPEECEEDLRRRIVSELRDLENWPFLEQRHDLKKIRGAQDLQNTRRARSRDLHCGQGEPGDPGPEDRREGEGLPMRSAPWGIELPPVTVSGTSLRASSLRGR